MKGAVLPGVLAAALLSAVSAFATPPPATIGRLSYIGESRIASGARFDGTEVGGLSSLLWNEADGRFYAISDDPSSRSPTRVYALEIDLTGGRLEEAGASIAGVTRLTDETGSFFEESVIDGESLARLPEGSLLVGSEGNLARGFAPALLELDASGRVIRRFALPARYLPAAGERFGAASRGVRHNKVFEGLAVAPDGRSFFTGLEGPLLQDAPDADVGVPSWLRIARWDVASGEITAEYVYPLEPVAEPPSPPEAFRVNGLVEMIALADGRLLTLERAYSQGVGNTVRLFIADPRSATDVQRASALEGLLPFIRPMSKRLLVDLGDLDLPLDNLEGMTFGPPLPDGRRSLVLVSDDNFNPDVQVTQFLAFAVSESAPRIPEIQGAAHRSPLEGDWLAGVMGLVTAVDPRSGFWMQDRGDGDPATADGIFVAAEAPALAPGDAVRVWGRVEEAGRSSNLPVTRIAATAWAVDAREVPLPDPVRLTHEGDSGSVARRLPGEVVDDDGLASFDPTADAADLWESLEGMRVAIEEARVVGPTTVYGGIGVVAENGRGAGPKTHRGGLLLREGDPNPERILLSSRLTGTSPAATVGDTFPRTLVGVVDHDYGHYRVLPTEPLPAPQPGGLTLETTDLRGGPDALSVATCNVLNLGGDAAAERMERLAEQIVAAMGAPHLLALQEIQDDNGVTDDGTVRAELTLGRLTEAIVAAGGPRYEWIQIDPIDGMDGGRPGGNIRSAVLYDPARFDFEGRAAPPDDQVARIDATPDGPRLAVNPSLVAPGDEAFQRSRKPLVVELTLDDEPLFVVALHLNSKGGDDPIFGARQPPRLESEVQRRRQAERIAELVEELLALDPTARIVVLGDLNEHEFRPPVTRLVEAGLVDLVAALPVDDRYSYNHEANSQLLDHILVSRSLAGGAVADIVHRNADYPASQQASDHDPVVGRLPLP